MPLVTTTISYESEEFGRNEVVSYSRDIEDLDLMDMLWYQLEVMRIAGFDVKDLHAITGQDRFYTTEE